MLIPYSPTAREPVKPVSALLLLLPVAPLPAEFRMHKYREPPLHDAESPGAESTS